MSPLGANLAQLGPKLDPQAPPSLLNFSPSLAQDGIMLRPESLSKEHKKKPGTPSVAILAQVFGLGGGGLQKRSFSGESERVQCDIDNKVGFEVSFDCRVLECLFPRRVRDVPVEFVRFSGGAAALDLLRPGHFQVDLRKSG